VLNSEEKDMPDRVESLIEEGLLRRGGDQRLFLTRAGKTLADPIAAKLI
jgi:hypothetical protein